METNQHEEGGDERLAGDLLVGAEAIRAFLVHLGMPESTRPLLPQADRPLADRQHRR